MDHFAPDEWIAYDRGALSLEKAAPLRQHLDTGCENCRLALNIWRRVTELASHEASYQPPAAIVHAVETAYRAPAAGGWLAEIATFASLVFDSFKQPSFASVRASASSSRQLLHESEPFTIDLRLESDPAHKRIYLIGQILNAKNPDEESSGIDVILLKGTDLVKRTLANASGEFDLDFGSEGDMQLFINIRGRRAIGIVLPDLDH